MLIFSGCIRLLFGNAAGVRRYGAGVGRGPQAFQNREPQVSHGEHGPVYALGHGPVYAFPRRPVPVKLRVPRPKHSLKTDGWHKRGPNGG